ncbi:hypothetical protein N0V93_004363 [Gnomoniopsis smithogilvyi]|uniref:Bul1 C-terminal domain-containing protein n=1 Tax=Gnomoniopsis smithogilvyi TaxID=1191159 RepID=A0A9W8YSH6_9PEZI|nr:hypothetical protein N0V93_004363 [Gnomoniopsis smithogilvyi]
MEETYASGSPYITPHNPAAINNTNLSVHLMSLASVFGTTNMPPRTVSASTRSEASSSLSGHARSTPFPKSDIQISIKNHFKTKTYTTSSPVSGVVTITTQRDIRFDSIEIDLIGTSKTRTEGYSAPNESTHTFLKLVMPIPESTYPVPRVLETGRTLTIPFHFVLPNFLTLSACHHKVDSELVREQHLCLPPSMGSWARGNWEKDDLAPHMAEVVYSIKARVWREPELDRGRAIKVMEAVKSIQVLPAFTESAPLTISENDPLYRMSRTKTLRKNLISSKLGTLTVSAQQPRAIALHPDGRMAADTVAQLDLHFTPLAADAQPPKITSVAAKIIAYTYYSAGPFNSLPNIGDFMKAGLAARRGLYSTSVSLPTATWDNNSTSWFTHRLSRRDSGYGSDTSMDEEPCVQQQQQQRPQRRKSSFATLIRTTRPPSPSTTTSGSVVHTTSIHLPLTLPTARKTFVPTFHSCIVSRVYALHVSVTLDSGAASKVSLDLPVQITVVGDAQGAAGGVGADEEELPSWAEAVEDAAVDEFLRPRVLGLMEGVSGGVGEEAGGLPGYERHG